MQSLTQRVYTSLLQVLSAGRGLAWHVDGTTTLRIDPRCRWIRNPSYEAEVGAYLKAGIRPGHCCVDVGAHVGFYAMQMALWTAPGGRVIAFEPNPTARAVLQANIALNKMSDRVTIEPSAAGAAAGPADLFHGDDTTGLSRLDAPNASSESGAPVRVPVVTLDEVLRGAPGHSRTGSWSTWKARTSPCSRARRRCCGTRRCRSWWKCTRPSGIRGHTTPATFEAVSEKLRPRRGADHRSEESTSWTTARSRSSRVMLIGA